MSLGHSIGIDLHTLPPICCNTEVHAHNDYSDNLKRKGNMSSSQKIIKYVGIVKNIRSGGSGQSFLWPHVKLSPEPTFSGVILR